MNKILTLITLWCVLISPAFSAAECDNQIKGINLAGLGFAPAQLPGVLGKHYHFPSPEHYAYYAGIGFNAVRLSVIWERWQPKLFEALDPGYNQLIEGAFLHARQYGLNVVIDLHNYHRYRGQHIGTEKVPVSAYIDAWLRISRKFSKYDNLLAYGLMNEPHGTLGQWENHAQAVVSAIRAKGDATMLYIAGDHWSNSYFWSKQHKKSFIQDPMNRFKYEAHLYVDNNSSGTYKDLDLSFFTKLEERVKKRLQPFVQWLKKENSQGVIGEFGIPNEDKWLPSLQAFLEQSKIDCLDWYMWSGGAWSSGYELSLQPVKGIEKRQILLIRNFIN